MGHFFPVLVVPCAGLWARLKIGDFQNDSGHPLLLGFLARSVQSDSGGRKNRSRLIRDF